MQFWASPSLRSGRAIRSITRAAFHAVAGGSATIPLASRTSGATVLRTRVSARFARLWYVSMLVSGTKYFHIALRVCLRRSYLGGGTPRERDSSGTTEATAKQARR
jgi:hypothetical protein